MNEGYPWWLLLLFIFSSKSLYSGSHLTNLPIVWSGSRVRYGQPTLIYIIDIETMDQDHGLPTLNLARRASGHEICTRQREYWGSLLLAPCLAAASWLLAELLFEFIMCVCLLILLGITFWGRNVLTQQLNCNLSSSFPFKLANSPVSGTVTVDIPGAVTLCASRSYTYSAALSQCQ